MLIFLSDLSNSLTANSAACGRGSSNFSFKSRGLFLDDKAQLTEFVKELTRFIVSKTKLSDWQTQHLPILALKTSLSIVDSPCRKLAWLLFDWWLFNSVAQMFCKNKEIYKYYFNKLVCCQVSHMIHTKNGLLTITNIGMAQIWDSNTGALKWDVDFSSNVESK